MGGAPSADWMSRWCGAPALVGRGRLGFLVHALSERFADSVLGLVLTGAAELAVVAGVALPDAGRATRSLSPAQSGALVALGFVAVGLVLTGPGGVRIGRTAAGTALTRRPA